MRDDDELRVLCQIVENSAETGDVGFVEHGVDLVEDAEGRGGHLKQGENERGGRQRALAAGEEPKALLAAVGQTADDFNTADGKVIRFSQSQVCGAAAEKPFEHFTEDT